MNKKVWNKLVRDKIPEICRTNGAEPTIRILSDEEYNKELNKKLLEEANEYIASEETEELADILEVLLAILNHKNLSFEDLEKIRKAKEEKRGGFKEKIFLESTTDK